MFKVNVSSLLVYIGISLAMILWLIPAYSPPYPGYGIPSTFFPNVLCYTILGLSCINLFRTLWKKLGSNESCDMSVSMLVRFFVIMGVLLLALPLMKLIHFVPGGFLIISVLQYLLGERNWLRIILVSGGTVAVLYVAFWYGLRVLLP